MEPDLTLRPASPDDLEAIVQVHLEARHAAPMPAPAREDEVPAGLAWAVAQGQVWVALGAGDEVVGYARFTDTWLEDLYVRPRAQRGGVGAALLEVVKQQVPDSFGLGVFEQNLPARRFYASQGLVELETSDGSDSDEGEPEVSVVWPGQDPLAYFRRCIDAVDHDLGTVLARRVALTRAVQVHKRRSLMTDEPGRDAAREEEIVERVLPLVPLLGRDGLRRVMHTIITESIEVSR